MFFVTSVSAVEAAGTLSLRLGMECQLATSLRGYETWLQRMGTTTCSPGDTTCCNRHTASRTRGGARRVLGKLTLLKGYAAHRKNGVIRGRARTQHVCYCR